MKCALALALALGCGIPDRMAADPPPRTDILVLSFAVPTETRRYGVLVRAPKTLSCPQVRYRIETVGRATVSAALGPGELQLVRLRQGLARGQAVLRVTAIGCPDLPAVARRVLLGRVSPDHSWRAARASADVEAHPLGKRQAGAVIERVCRPPHIGLPGI